MRFKSTWALVAVLAAMGAYLHFVEEPARKASEAAKQKEGLLFPDLDTAKVTELSLQSPRGTIRVRKGEGDRWAMVEPMEDRADDGRIRTLLGDLKALRAEKDAAPARADLEAFGLATPAVLLETAGVAITVAVGAENPAGDSRYVRVGNGPVKVAKSYGLGSLLVEAKDLRSKDVLESFPWTRLQSVEVRSPETHLLRLVKTQGKWRLEAPFAGEAEPDKAEALAEKLRWAKISSFRDDDAGSAGDKLAKGVSVVLRADGQAQPATVTLAEVGREVWGERAGRAAFFTLPKDVLEAFRVKPEDLRRLRPVLAKTWSAEKLELTAAGKSLRYEKVEGAWRRQGQTVRGAESDALQALLTSFEEGKAVDVLDPPGADAAFGLDAPKVTARLSDSQNGEQALELGEKGGKVFARAGRSGPVYPMPPDYLSKATAVFRAVDTAAKPAAAPPR